MTSPGVDTPRLVSVLDPRRLLPSPRLVSRLVLEPSRDDDVIYELSNLVQQWGQFLDHDITGTPANKGGSLVHTVEPRISDLGPK